MLGDDWDLVLTASNALHSAVSDLHAHAEKSDDTRAWTGAKDPSLGTVEASLTASKEAIQLFRASKE